ncbi:MAG: hypothetical protein H3C49_11805 [Alphaproteobacteria bacterium]|nr:hypothetical protein [Alphaproteobacteria bacterium]
MSPRKNDKEPEQTSIKDSWEFKTGKFILRIVAVLFFLTYLLIAFPQALSWGWQSYHRQQPLAALEKYIDGARKGDQKTLLKWIQLRPESERPEIIEKLTPYSGGLTPLFFLTFARWEGQADNIDKAIFWNFLARYRLRYDALRCGAPNAIENMDGLVALLPDGLVVPTVAKYDKKMLIDYLGRVLAFDAEYPANNNPANLCVFINNLEGKSFMLVDPKDWNALRHSLRRVTEWELERMKAETPANDEAPAADNNAENGTKTDKPE